MKYEKCHSTLPSLFLEYIHSQRSFNKSTSFFFKLSCFNFKKFQKEKRKKGYRKLKREEGEHLNTFRKEKIFFPAKIQMN